MNRIHYPHNHRCTDCQKTYTAAHIWDRQDFAKFGECACEGTICQGCSEKLVESEVEFEEIELLPNLTAKLITVDEGTALTFVDVQLSDGRTVHTAAEFNSDGGKYGALWQMALMLSQMNIEVIA